MRKIINVKSGKVCALCQYWYDPTNSVITPKSGDFWEYDTNAKKRCLKKVGTEMLATSYCMEYKCKL